MSKQQQIYELIQNCDHITVDGVYDPIFVDNGFGGKPCDPVIEFKYESEELENSFVEFSEENLMDAEIKNGNEIHLKATNGEECVLELFRQVKMSLEEELDTNYDVGYHPVLSIKAKKPYSPFNDDMKEHESFGGK